MRLNPGACYLTEAIMRKKSEAAANTGIVLHRLCPGSGLTKGIILAASLSLPTISVGTDKPQEVLTPIEAFRSFDRHNASGLPQSSVRSLAQDGEGDLWLGTLDGLARYDGSEIEEVLPPTDQPSFGDVVDLQSRRQGGIFVAGPSGVRVFDGHSWRLGSLRKSVVSLAEDRNDRLWVVDQQGAVWREENVPDGPWESIPMPAGLGPATKVSCNGEEGVWVTSRVAVASVWGNLAETAPPLPKSVQWITVLRADGEAGVWIGTQVGEVWHIAHGDSTWSLRGNVPAAKQPILCMSEDRLHRLLCGTAGGTLAFARPNGGWTVWGPSNGLSSSGGITALLVDREGTLWVGENAHGAQQFFSEAWSHRTTWEDSGSQIPAAVFGLAPTIKGGLLATLLGGGLWQWEDGHLTEYGASAGLPAATRCVAEPEPGIIWVGGRGGVFESRHGSHFSSALVLPGGIVNGLCVGPDHVWRALTTTEGIIAKKGEEWVPETDLNRNLTDLNVRALLWRANGEIWAATMGGVTIIKGEAARSYSHTDNIAVPTPVQCLLEMGPDEVWVGGTGGIGVWSGGKWHAQAAQERLPGRTIYALARESDGTTWVAGGAGVGRLSGNNWTIFNTQNALFDDECNLNGLVISPDGSVYVGTMGGLARYNPRVVDSLHPTLHCFWRTRPEPSVDGIAHLPKGIRAVSLSWSAPWLTPTPVEYRSRVTPLLDSWSEPSREHSLKFANLGPGIWTFEVEARIAGSQPGDWTPPLATRIEIPRFFIETVWAPVLSAAAVLALLIMLVIGRTRHLQRRHRELEKAVADAQASVKTLRGLIPICASCKSIRDDKGAWSQLEAYVREHSEAEFSHGICPACAKRLYPEVTTEDYPPL